MLVRWALICLLLRLTFLSAPLACPAVCRGGSFEVVFRVQNGKLKERRLVSNVADWSAIIMWKESLRTDCMLLLFPDHQQVAYIACPSLTFPCMSIVPVLGAQPGYDTESFIKASSHQQLLLSRLTNTALYSPHLYHLFLPFHPHPPTQTHISVWLLWQTRQHTIVKAFWHNAWAREESKTDEFSDYQKIIFKNPIKQKQKNRSTSPGTQA